MSFDDFLKTKLPLNLGEFALKETLMGGNTKPQLSVHKETNTKFVLKKHEELEYIDLGGKKIPEIKHNQGKREYELGPIFERILNDKTIHYSLVKSTTSEDKYTASKYIDGISKPYSMEHSQKTKVKHLGKIIAACMFIGDADLSKEGNLLVVERNEELSFVKIDHGLAGNILPLTSMLSQYNKFMERLYGFNFDFDEFMQTINIITSISNDEIFSLVEFRMELEPAFEFFGCKIAAEYKKGLIDICSKYTIELSEIAKYSRFKWITINEIKKFLESKDIKDDLLEITRGTHSEVAESIIFNKEELTKFQIKVNDLINKLDITYEEIGKYLSLDQINSTCPEEIYNYAKENEVCLKYSNNIIYKDKLDRGSDKLLKAKLFSDYCKETGKDYTEIPIDWWNNQNTSNYYSLVIDILKKYKLSPNDFYKGKPPPEEILNAVYDSKNSCIEIDESFVESASKELLEIFLKAKKCHSSGELDHIQVNNPIASKAWEKIKEVFKLAEEKSISFSDLSSETVFCLAETSIKLINLFSDNNIPYEIVGYKSYTGKPTKIIEKVLLIKEYGFVINLESVKYTKTSLLGSLSKFCEENNIPKNLLPMQLNWDINFSNASEIASRKLLVDNIIKLSQLCDLNPNEVPYNAIERAFNPDTGIINMKIFDDIRDIILLFQQHNCPLSEIRNIHWKKVNGDHNLSLFTEWMEEDYPLAGHISD